MVGSPTPKRQRSAPSTHSNDVQEKSEVLGVLSEELLSQIRMVLSSQVPTWSKANLVQIT